MRIGKESLALASDMVDTVIQSTTECFDGDNSFIPFLRACAINAGYGIDALKSAIAKRFRVYDRDEIFEVSSSGDGSMITFVEVTDHIDEIMNMEVPNGTSGSEKYDMFLSQYAGRGAGKHVRCFVNEEQKKTTIVVDRRLSHVLIQAVEATLPKAAPWLFVGEIKEYLGFLKTIMPKADGEDSQIKSMIDFIAEAEKKIDLRTITLHKMLDGYEDKTRNDLIKRLQSEIDGILETIERYSTELAEKYSDLDTAKTRLNAMVLLPEKNSNRMFEFFHKRDYLHVIKVFGSEIKYGVTGFLTNYDPEEFIRIMNSDGSYLNSLSNDLKNALKAVFVDGIATFRVNAVFRIKSGMVKSIADETSPESEGTIPNPHTYYYACNGANDMYYHQYAKTGDWDMAIDQSVAATQNINFGDVTVGRRFVNYLSCRLDEKILVKPDGTAVSLNDIMKEIKKNG